MAEKIPGLFGRVVRRRRRAAGLTQEALAHGAKLSRNYVGMLERGERTPTLIALRLLAAALGTTMSALVQELEAALAAEGETERPG
jgi:transcriptional regulator with XRE-family HTH domain